MTPQSGRRMKHNISRMFPQCMVGWKCLCYHEFGRRTNIYNIYYKYLNLLFGNREYLVFSYLSCSVCSRKRWFWRVLCGIRLGPVDKICRLVMKVVSYAPKDTDQFFESILDPFDLNPKSLSIRMTPEDDHRVKSWRGPMRKPETYHARMEKG